MVKLKLFSAAWCAPCKMLKKNLELLKTTVEFELEMIDIDTDPEHTQKAMVRGVPTLLSLDSNELEIDRTSGNKSLDELRLFIQGGC